MKDDELRTRHSIEVVTHSGAAADVEFWVGIHTVEVWHHGLQSAIFDRQHLSDWLADPGERLRVNAVELTVDGSVDTRGRVAISLPDVTAWTLSPTSLSQFTSAVSSRGERGETTWEKR